MARWRVLAPSYINITWLPENDNGSEWEYQETDATSGRQIRKRFKVPLYLNPRDPQDHNYRELGQIIVADRRSPGNERDLIFEGNPTPDWDPLDDEAKRISASFEGKWKHPINDLPSSGGQDYGASLIAYFERQLDEARKGGPVQPVSTANADGTTLSKLQARLDALEAENLKLQAKMSGESEPVYDIESIPAPKSKAAVRRV